MVVEKGGSTMEGIKEVMVSLMKKLLLNACKAVLGQVLPAGYSCNYVRFLLKETKQVKVNQEVVKAEMVYQGYQAVIARSVGERWWLNLTRENKWTKYSADQDSNVHSV